MKLKLSLLLFLATTLVYAQVGGDMVYSFLGVPTSARAAGLGGVPVSLSDNDFNLATQNPALLSDTGKAKWKACEPTCAAGYSK